MSAHWPQRRRPTHQTPHTDVAHPTIILVTACTAGRRPLLARPEAVAALLAAWTAADHWLVGRYVVMPDHVHLFASPGGTDPRTLSAWVAYWKSLASRAWPHEEDQPVWQRDFWDTQIRARESYEAKWEYVRQNPVRRGLVSQPEDWPFAGELNVLHW